MKTSIRRRAAAVAVSTAALMGGGTVLATAASAQPTHPVDYARACQEQGGGGNGYGQPWGISCYNVSFPWGAQITGSANPWRYCWDHYRQQASVVKYRWDLHWTWTCY